ncbi:hypothetical protein DID88_004383 [Monilinia fructigena]|uniref:Major facilitator superfamily (MFS) profile domain-containing protein n=1 Tax=Monilinia fructigena TaxID=38457 RepID=A0A395ISL5_9HELO|nr:hypothetical protein DID88_004383 [Monilinia fructigena]
MAQSISQSDSSSHTNVNRLQRASIENVVREKGMQEEAATESVVVKVATRFSEKEVTMRQVAPLVLILTGATFLSTISAQAVIIILPEVARDLNVPQARQQWIISSYALTSGSFLLLWGKLGDVYGHTIPPGRVKNYSFAFYSGGAPMGQVLGNLMGGIISQWASWKVVFFVIAGASITIAVVLPISASIPLTTTKIFNFLIPYKLLSGTSHWAFLVYSLLFAPDTYSLASMAIIS